MSKLRLVVAEDHRLLREALVAVLGLQSDMEVIGQAGSAAEALAVVEALAPDVLLLDFALPDGGGIEVVRRLSGARTRVLAIAMLSGAKYLQEALRSGVSGYITKNAGAEELLLAVRAVGSGRSYLAVELFHTLYPRNDASAAGEPPPATILGMRERQVLVLVARGLRTGEIAGKMNISPATVEAHRRNISRKVGLHGVADFTKYALREGLIEP